MTANSPVVVSKQNSESTSRSETKKINENEVIAPRDLSLSSTYNKTAVPTTPSSAQSSTGRKRKSRFEPEEPTSADGDTSPSQQANNSLNNSLNNKKQNRWDMFAEADTPADNYNVSFY